MAEVIRTPAQEAVVRHRGGALLVSAAAGSGKTKVLVDRLMERVCDPVNPRNIDDFLIITYTNLAAAELRTKIAAEVGKRLSADPTNRHLQRQLSRIYLAQISTVHAFCGELLRSYAFRLELPADFRIAEEQETLPLRERCLQRVLDSAYEELAHDERLRALVDTLGAGRSDAALSEIVMQMYLKVQCHLYPEQWMQESEDKLPVSDCADAADTPWGAFLLRELSAFCLRSAAQLKQLGDLCAQEEKLRKAYAPTLWENAEQLRTFGTLRGWDALYAAKPQSLGRLGSVRDCGDPALQERVKAVRQSVKKELERQCRILYAPSAEILAELAQSAQAISGLYALVRAFSKAYQAEKRRRHLLDFNDLEHETIRLLLDRSTLQPTAAAREIAQRYAEIMVDEYQDTNAVQDAIFRAVSKEGENRFLVGDVKQSIYRFRLADPSIFLNKYKTYVQTEEEAPGTPRKILLSENFRSCPEILHAVNDVFTMVMSEEVGELQYGETEALSPGIPRERAAQPPVELHCIESDYDAEDEERAGKDEIEAEFVAQRIAQMVRQETLSDGRPICAGDVVILLRSVRSHAADYQRALAAHGIAVSCDDGENLLCTSEVETLFGLLQTIDNPHQDIPLLSALTGPLFGFSNDALGKIRLASRETDLFDALCLAAEQDEACARFLQMLRRLQTAAGRMTVRQLLDEIDRETNFFAIYGAMPDAARRVRNLHAFLSLVDSTERSGQKSLGQLLDALQCLRTQGVKGSGETRQNAVTIMSIHKSKGLEFPVVILAGLSRSFNRDDLKKPVLVHPQMGVGANTLDPVTRVRYPTIAKTAIARRIDRENLSEELRVLYVAMTRARDRLVMTYCSKYLRRELRDIAQELTVPASPILAGSARCAGHWILQAALSRTEAGALFAAAEKPACSYVHEEPWRIELHSGRAVMQAALGEGSEKAPEEEAKTCRVPPDLERLLSFQYAGKAACTLPTKLTATQLKGRGLDEETAAETQARTPTLHFRKPSFVEEQRGLTAAERGTATHLAMQFLRYERCTQEAEIEQELDRLVHEEFLTAQQREAVSARKLWQLFRSELGQRIRSAPQLVREFKFSVLVEADAYFPNAAGEWILLQGVTDCCILEENGITVIDFKTDRVAPGGEYARAERYKGQLDAYALALSRIFEKNVKQKILYFFATDSAVYL